MNTKPWKITHKKPVSEQEFLKHLWRVCPNEYARSLVLAYYKKLKRFDHQHGKQISINAYDFVPFLGAYGDHLPDQAKHLFGRNSQLPNKSFRIQTFNRELATYSRHVQNRL